MKQLLKKLMRSLVTPNFSRYDRWFMSSVRRVTPALMATELVGTQPMNGPTGMTCKLRASWSITEEKDDN